MTDDFEKGRKRPPAGTGSRWEMAQEWASGEADPTAPNPQAQAVKEPSEWSDEASSSPSAGSLPVPPAAPPKVDALLDHLAAVPSHGAEGLPEVNEWDLGARDFGVPADVKAKSSAPPSTSSSSAPSPRPSDLRSEEPSPRRVLSASGRPAVSRGGAAAPIQPRTSGHRRRARAPGSGGAESDLDKPKKRVIPADVDLGLASDLPERPVEEEEAERRALQAAKGRLPARSTSTFFVALLFLLPLGLLLGARQLERVQRERAVPEVGVLDEGEAVGADAEERLPLLQPLPPYSAPVR